MILNPRTKKWLVGGAIIVPVILFVGIIIFIRMARDRAGATNQTTNIYNVVVDTDRDGLDDDAEKKIYNTDSTKEDTDGDGLSDFQETQQFKTDPLNAHSKDPSLADSQWVYKNSMKQTIQYK